MKKLILFVLSVFFISTNLRAWESVPLTVSYDDLMPIGNGHPKTPVHAPAIYIEGYTLTFTAGHPDYVLNIKDEDGNVVYSTVVTSSQTTVVLPSALSGDYVIELVMGNWLFTGYIIL